MVAYFPAVMPSTNCPAMAHDSAGFTARGPPMRTNCSAMPSISATRAS